jgi:esterase/lipase superfamily enzyme
MVDPPKRNRIVGASLSARRPADAQAGAALKRLPSRTIKHGYAETSMRHAALAADAGKPTIDRRRGRPRLRSLAIVALSLALLGCAGRPGPEALNAVGATVPGARQTTIYVATTRRRVSPDANVFSADRAEATSYAEFVISIPPSHKPGDIELPGASPDPRSTFVTVSQRVLDKPTFEAEISRQRGARPPKVGVYVHGYNINFQEAVFRMAQMVADANIDGVPIVFAWPSEGRETGYVADKDAAAFSRNQLAALLTMLARRPGFGRIDVLGHSMGGWLTMEALRQLRLTRQDATIRRLNVVLAAPDIDVDVFREQLAVIGPLTPPLTVLVARDDAALSLSRFVADQHDRVGAADVRDPKLAEAVRAADVQVIDISSVEAPDMLKHERFAQLAALYPKLSAEAAGGQGADVRQSGVFVLNAVGATVSSPFAIGEKIIGGE